MVFFIFFHFFYFYFLWECTDGAISSLEPRKGECRLGERRSELCRKTKTRAPAECTPIGCYYMMHRSGGCYMPTAPCKKTRRRVKRGCTLVANGEHPGNIHTSSRIHSVHFCKSLRFAGKEKKHLRCAVLKQCLRMCCTNTAHAAHSVRVYPRSDGSTSQL